MGNPNFWDEVFLLKVFFSACTTVHNHISDICSFVYWNIWEKPEVCYHCSVCKKNDLLLTVWLAVEFHAFLMTAVCFVYLKANTQYLESELENLSGEQLVELKVSSSKSNENLWFNIYLTWNLGEADKQLKFGCTSWVSLSKIWVMTVNYYSWSMIPLSVYVPGLGNKGKPMEKKPEKMTLKIPEASRHAVQCDWWRNVLFELPMHALR